MADLRVPLDAVEALTGRRYRLHTQMADSASRTNPSGTTRDLVGMRRPDRDPVRVALQDIVMFEDINLDRAKPPLAPGGLRLPGRRDDVQPKTDAEDREAEVQVVGGNPVRSRSGRRRG